MRWKDLNWEYGYLSPDITDSKSTEKFGKDNKLYEETRKQIIVNGRHFGKVTDCGYDAFACCYAAIPFSYEIEVEVDLIVRSFPSREELTGQEAFGLFLRDTMEAEPLTGYCYSNMAAVGAWGGTLNFFGRSGITRLDHGHIKPFWAVREDASPGLGMINERMIHAVLKTNHSKVSAAMSDSQGNNLIGETELLKTCMNVSCENGRYYTEMDDNSLGFLDSDSIYLGFFATHDAEIVVLKDSLRITAGGERFDSRRIIAETDVKDPFSEPPQDIGLITAETAPEILWASPDGKAEGDGSADSPLDLITAIDECIPGKELRLEPGTYSLTETVTLGSAPDETGRKKLVGLTEHDNKVIIDFGGTDSCLCITGDNWDVEGITVIRGMGITIRGNNNHLYRCKACGNHETGILIRDEDNYSQRRNWPSYNVIEECVSYNNRCRSERNADGFACKVAAGEGNRFFKCVAFLNSDDGFDLFAKNRKTGAVELEGCESYLNGYKIDDSGNLVSTKGNGNGFKLGGSGERVEHVVRNCIARGNRKYGFTNNSNPYMKLVSCAGQDNLKDIRYYTYGTDPDGAFETEFCRTGASDDFDMVNLLHELIGKYDG